MADASAWKVELEAEGDAWKAKQDAHAEQTARHVDEIAELYTLVGQAPAGNPNSLDTARDCLTAGSGTAYTATFAPAFTSLVNGIELKVRWHTDNGENPTLDLDELGPRGIVRPDGGAPEAGALKANYTGKLVYNATLDKWVLVSNIPQAPPIATLSAKSSDYSIQADDLRAVTIVPIDISGQSVDIKELALASMTGLVRYVVSAWDDAGDTYKARVIDASDAEVATLYAEGDYIDIAYNGTTRIIGPEQVTVEGYVPLTANNTVGNGSPGNSKLWDENLSVDKNIGAWGDFSSNFRIDIEFDCVLHVRVKKVEDISFSRHTWMRLRADGTDVDDSGELGADGPANAGEGTWTWTLELNAGQYVEIWGKNFDSADTARIMGNVGKDQSRLWWWLERRRR